MLGIGRRGSRTGRGLPAGRASANGGRRGDGGGGAGGRSRAGSAGLGRARPPPPPPPHPRAAASGARGSGSGSAPLPAGEAGAAAAREVRRGLARGPLPCLGRSPLGETPPTPPRRGPGPGPSPQPSRRPRPAAAGPAASLPAGGAALSGRPLPHRPGARSAAPGLAAPSSPAAPQPPLRGRAGPRPPPFPRRPLPHARGAHAPRPSACGAAPAPRRPGELQPPSRWRGERGAGAPAAHSLWRFSLPSPRRGRPACAARPTAGSLSCSAVGGSVSFQARSKVSEAVTFASSRSFPLCVPSVPPPERLVRNRSTTNGLKLPSPRCDSFLCVRVTRFEYSLLLLLQLCRASRTSRGLAREPFCWCVAPQSPPLAGRECSGFFPFLSQSSTCLNKGIKPI